MAQTSRQPQNPAALPTTNGSFLGTWTLQDRLVAAMAVPLVLNWQWVHRRVERIEMLDEARIRRTTTIELTIPDPKQLIGVNVRLGVMYIPILFARRHLRQGFQLSDEAGKLIPVATRSKTAHFEFIMLASVAEALLIRHRPKARLHRDLQFDLQAVIEGDLPTALDALRNIAGGRGGKVPQGQLLWQDALFRMLAYDLFQQYILFAEIDAVPRVRRIVEMRDEEELQGKEQDVRRVQFPLLRGARLWPVRARPQYKLPLSQATECESYQIEVCLPPQLVFRSVTPAIGPSSIGIPRKRPQVDIGRHCVAVRVESQERRPTPILMLGIGLDRDGILQSAHYAALATAFLSFIAIALHILVGLEPIEGVAGAVLVVLPVIFAAFLIRDGEHPMVTWFSKWPRLCISVAAVASYVLAVSLSITMRLGPFWRYEEHTAGWHSVVWAVVGILIGAIAYGLGRERHPSPPDQLPDWSAWR